MNEWPLPIKGVDYSTPQDKENPANSSYMLNVRPFDVLERRIRLGQRPGMDKLYSQQIGGNDIPVVCIFTITTVD